MKMKYMIALKRPAALFSLPCKKNDTVIGIIGNTHGVNNAARPHMIA